MTDNNRISPEINNLVQKLLRNMNDAKRNNLDYPYETKLPKFTLADLVGKTIEQILIIPNPLPYNKEVESPNPKKIKALIYSDGSYLFHMDVGWQDGSTLHTFLVEEDNIRYSHKLYEDEF